MNPAFKVKLIYVVTGLVASGFLLVGMYLHLHGFSINQIFTKKVDNSNSESKVVESNIDAKKFYDNFFSPKQLDNKLGKENIVINTDDKVVLVSEQIDQKQPVDKSKASRILVNQTNNMKVDWSNAEESRNFMGKLINDVSLAIQFIDSLKDSDFPKGVADSSYANPEAYMNNSRSVYISDLIAVHIHNFNFYSAIVNKYKQVDPRSMLRADINTGISMQGGYEEALPVLTKCASELVKIPKSEISDFWDRYNYHLLQHNSDKHKLDTLYSSCIMAIFKIGERSSHEAFLEIYNLLPDNTLRRIAYYSMPDFVFLTDMAVDVFEMYAKKQVPSAKKETRLMSIHVLGILKDYLYTESEPRRLKVMNTLEELSNYPDPEIAYQANQAITRGIYASESFLR